VGWLPSLYLTGFHCVGMITRLAIIPWHDLLGLFFPGPSGDTPLVLGALRPARGLLVVSLPCSSRLLYLEVWPNNFYSYSVIWSALYLLAMELVSLGFQPSPRYSSLTPLEFYLAFSDIEAILDAPSSWPICCSAT